MDLWLAAVLGSMLDPIRLVPAILLGIASKRWVHVGAGALVISLALAALAVGLDANVYFFAGLVATGLLASAAFSIKQALQSKRQKAETNSD